jgi:DNA-binding NtrC family response regulator
MKDVVDELICRTVTYAGGNKVRAAKILGVGRRTIYSRLETTMGTKRTAA